MADSATWGEWEDTDDDLDDLLFATTQVVEQEQEKQLHELLTQTTTRGASSADPNMTPNVAAHAFNLRRENLRPSDSNAFGESNRSVSTAEYRNPNDAATKIQSLNKQYANEKSNNYKLKSQLVAAQGESNNLRRQVETLKLQQQEELCGRLQRDREDKVKFDQEKKQLMQDISALRTQLRIAQNEISREKSKSAVFNTSNRSIGGAMSQCPTKTELNLSKSSLKSPPLTPKHKSDPYLNTPVQQKFARSVQHATAPPMASPEKPVNQPKVNLNDQGVQVNASLEEMGQRLNEMFCVEDEVDVSKMENMHSLHTVKSLRRKTYETIQSLIQRDYKYHAKDLMEWIASKAPKEIMARFTRGVELKTKFPTLIENMFLYGIQVQKQKENHELGGHEQKKYPKLPKLSNDSSNPRIINLHKLQDKLEYCFVDSAWMALKEIKEQLKLLLTALNEDSRFRLYEYQNLQALWELLSWAKYLWRFIVFEEEFEHIVDSKGKTLWIEELRGWTGLMLKIAWRDFYIPELEQLVRQFSLNILEIIVTTGYFDSSQRRYEILYSILKDTMIKDHLRNEQSLRRCLNIITWSVADNRNILNYLCMNDKNGNNCLARILGENVLKCFKETECPKKSTSLLLHYFHLLEVLMVENVPLFFSKVAPQPNQTTTTDDDGSGSEESIWGNGVDSMDVDSDMMCTQLACPDKYKFEDGTKERAKQFNNVKAAPCWISPQEWEIQIDDIRPPEEHVCQCRKILLGSTFIMLYHVVPWWRTSSVINCQRLVEQRQNIAVEELRKLKESNEEKTTSSKERKEMLDQHLQSLHKYVIAVSTEESFYENQMQTFQTAPATIKEEKDPEGELLWEEYLKYWDSPSRHAMDERGITDTIFDFVVQSGILFMNFCNFHSENIALAAGSEAFNDFSLLVSAVNLHGKSPWIKEAQMRFLMEIVKSGEDDNEPIHNTSNDADSCSNLESDYNDDDNYANCGSKVDLVVNDRRNTDYLFIDQFEPVQPPRKRISDEEFDKKFRCLQVEMRNEY